MRELTIHPRDLATSRGVKEAEFKIAETLHQAGFAFVKYELLTGTFKLKGPFEKKPNPDGSMTFRQWDPLPQKGSPV